MELGYEDDCNVSPDIAHETSTDPSKLAHDNAKLWKTSYRYKTMQRNAGQQIIDELHKGFPVAVSLPVYQDDDPTVVHNNWTSPEALVSGVVDDPPPFTQTEEGHAVCLLGYDEDSSGGWFLVRNSWGNQWATSPNLQDPTVTTCFPGRTAGYGLVSFAYVNDFLWEMCIV